MTDTEAHDGAAVQFPPPFVPLIALVIGVGMQYFVWSVSVPFEGFAKYVLGGALVACGLVLVMAAMKLFDRTGQDPKPWKSTPEIIATGVYAWTRNPMYLAMGLLQAGIGTLFSNAWIVALVPVTWIVIFFIAIRHEEAYLERKFGASYIAYKSSVRRWL